MDPDLHVTPDKFQQAWQTQDSQLRVSIDPELLQKEVRRNQLEFRGMIFVRDFREIIVAMLLIPLTFFMGSMLSLPWTWYLSVPAYLWMIGFLLIDRKRHQQEPDQPGDALLVSVKKSLTQVEHQIWLLRNVFWWYLLPPGIAITAFFTQVTWQTAAGHPVALVLGGFLFSVLWTIYYFLDSINQRAVRLQLEPRRQELLTLLSSLGEQSQEDDGKAGLADSIENSALARRWLVVAVVLLLILIAIVLAGGRDETNDDGFPRSSVPSGKSLTSPVAVLHNY